MARAISDDMRDPLTPHDVEIRGEARAPEVDPTLGIAVAAAPADQAPHRLVVLGDSLSHGFKSGAIHDTELSYPATIAWEMGFFERFRRPTYDGFGGLPFNLEWILHDLEAAYGDKLSWWELAPAAFRLRHRLAEIEDWWDRGPGGKVPTTAGIMHNLAVYGFDLRDALTNTAAHCDQVIAAGGPPSFLVPILPAAEERAALRVLRSAQLGGKALSPVEAARALGDEGDPGIETLVVMLGANNALGVVTQLAVRWSEDGYDDLDRKAKFTVWRPTHFAAELAQLVATIKTIKARHVVLATVPHVTIAPIARGVGRGPGDKVRRGSRYYPYYTRPWIAPEDFNPTDDPKITAAEARAVDSAIDQYNVAITDAVRTARQEGRDWYLLEIAGMLDRLASRRYIEDPAARPDWWTPYELPSELAGLSPPLTSRFFVTGPQGRADGGLFSLDGVHPTTVAYGLIAQEIVNVMQRAKVKFYWGDGRTERTGPVRVDFARLLRADSLLTSPPASLTGDLRIVGWIDEKLDFFKRLLHRL